MCDWKGKGININGDYILHLKFTGDIVIIATPMPGLDEMFNSLGYQSTSKLIGLKINLNKTKLMYNSHISSKHVIVNGGALRVIQEYVYLNQ